MSLKQKLVKHWHKFLQSSLNIHLGNAPAAGKERKYEQVDIQNKFEEVEAERKAQRLRLIEHKQKLRKKVLERELNLMREIDVIGDGKHMSITQNEKHNYETLKKMKMDMGGIDEQRNVITKELAQIELELKEIDAQRQELSLVNQQILDLEPEQILLKGLQKKAVMNMLKYYEFQSRHLAGMFLNPETKKNIEIVHYHIQNNLPLNRELLYEVLPELFEKEINEMDEYKRNLLLEKRPRFESDHKTILGIVEKLPRQQEQLDFFETLEFQEQEMLDFVFKTAKLFCEKHHNYIEMKYSQGIPSFEEIWDQLVTKTNRTDEENAIYEEYQELKKLTEDHLKLVEVNKVRAFQEQRTLHIPEFVKQNETLLKAWTEKWEQIIKNSFDFSESVLIPQDYSYESKLDKAIQDYREADIRELIESSNAEYRDLAEIPLRDNQDRRQKDEKLVRKMQIMTGVMDSIKIDEKKQITMPKRKKTNQILLPEDRGEEERIHLNELPKVLYLNNKDPQKYNIQFWAKHFNIEPQKLRNIFNFVSYPIITGDTKQETQRVLRFIQFNQEQQQQSQSQQ